MKFYRDITLGQYVPGGSVVHRVEAGTKVIELMGLIVSIFLVYVPNVKGEKSSKFQCSFFCELKKNEY